MASHSRGIDLMTAVHRLVSMHALALALFLLFAFPAFAQTFPALAGRVTDAANILKPDDRARIETRLKAYEDRTSDQVVVATVPSLEGVEVEDYANRLFRHWKLGTGTKNNGALLLVAPTERKVRIEVGYGLEGALTDALSGTIIRTAIAPKFKTGDFAGGIEAGVDAMLSILSGDAEEWQRRPAAKSDDLGAQDLMILFFVAVVFFIVIRGMFAARGTGRAYRRQGGGWIIPTGGGSWGGGGGFGGGGGGFGGGFSGGGGSSGGGGASGSW